MPADVDGLNHHNGSRARSSRSRRRGIGNTRPRSEDDKTRQYSYQTNIRFSQTLTFFKVGIGLISIPSPIIRRNIMNLSVITTTLQRSGV
jgi:hypothetical protein